MKAFQLFQALLNKFKARCIIIYQVFKKVGIYRIDYWIVPFDTKYLCYLSNYFLLLRGYYSQSCLKEINMSNFT